MMLEKRPIRADPEEEKQPEAKRDPT